MKIRLLLFFCCLSLFTNAQVTSLNKLSSGQYYTSDVIKDVNNNIKGYFIVFTSDKVAKETYEFEYVIMDENLKKVTNGFITEMKFESFLTSAARINIRVVSLYKNKILIELTDALGVGSYRRYRILDIKSNEMSDPFLYNDDKLDLHPEIDRKLKNYKKNTSERMDFYDGAGLVVNSVYTDKKTHNTRYLAHFDDEMKETWKYVYDVTNDGDKMGKVVYYLNSDPDVILMQGHVTKKEIFQPEYSAIILDTKTGKLRSEYTFPKEEENEYRIVDTHIDKDKIYVMATFFKNDTKNMGMIRFTFNKSDGKLLDTKKLLWADFAGKLDINEKGYVKKEGNLYLHNMLMLENGKTIVVAETFEQAPVTTNNMYFFTLSENFGLEDIFTVEKFRNKFPGTAATSATIKAQGAFDFIDYQNLGDDEFLFFLSDNEKKSKNRNKTTLYGIVSYSDGKFKRQTLNLKTETSTIYVMNGKKGYLFFVEDFDEKGKSSEFRLEKINY